MTGMIAAVIMCGGKGERMVNSSIEKPLQQLGGKTMVEWVMQALTKSNKFTQTMAAVSPHTPETSRLLVSKGIKIIKTPGAGFSQDLLSCLSSLRPERVLVVPADLPLINSFVVGKIVDLLAPNHIPAISTVLTKRFVEEIGVRPSIEVEVGGVQCCHSGITLFETTQIQAGLPVPEKYMIVDRMEIAVNVNTKDELEVARRLLIERSEHLSKD